MGLLSKRRRCPFLYRDSSLAPVPTGFLVIFTVMRALLLLVALVAAFGCNPTPPSEPKSDAPAPTPTASNPAPTGGSGGVTPIGSGAAGGMTPVTGAENVGGAGMGGIASAAKNQAQNAAASAGQGSMGSAGVDGGGE